MDPNRWKQIDELVDAALDVPDDERDAFIESRANGDNDLKRAVAELVAAHGKSNEFLQHSAMKIVAQALANDEPSVQSASLLNKKIATYKILKLLGAGGMGEVYLAFDEKMKRNVALKILPAEYGSHDERVKRFEMEARAISSINHPNIVTIYDVGNFEGINYIATEFVEGKTLRELTGGKFKLGNVMANSVQICDALSAAHDVGVIHRDIKPENIMIRKDGYAKILDFGVAKLTEVGLETMSNFANTTKGVIIGTPGYMSPAQICGDPIDHRTDIWSCGVVLYEFLTGKNPFKEKNRQATFQAILSKTPRPPSELNPEIPYEIDAILLKILEKDRDDGYQTAVDLRADLKRVKREIDSSASGTYSGSSAMFRRRSVWPRRLAVALAAAFILVAGLAVWALFFRGVQTQNANEWTAAKSLQITNQPGKELFPSLSPDGKDIVYAGRENGNLDIFLLKIGGKRATNLTAGSLADDTEPAFSPNGNLIAFRSEREPRGIYTIEVSGDNLRRISDIGYHPSWSPDGKFLVVSTWGREKPTVRASPNESLRVIDIESGTSRELLQLEATFPAWSPNGHRIAYWFYTGTYGRRDIATIPAGGGEPVVVVRDFAVSNWNPVWSPDGKYLYFVSSHAGNMNFWRVAIDETSGEVLGKPEPVVTPSTFSRHLTFSRDGKRLAYVQTNDTANIQGVNFDEKAGKAQGDPFWITQGDREISRAELSPDGTQFVMRLIRPTQDDIVTVSRDGREWRDVTNDEPFDRYVRWSPDSKTLAFGSDRNGGGQVWISNADGTGLRQLTKGGSPEFATGFPVWSPDGKALSINHNGITTIVDPSRTTEDPMPPPIEPDPSGAKLTGWDWSPDGTKLAGIVVDGTKRHIGYYDFETRRYEIVVPNVNDLPAWLPDSRRFIYASNNRIFLVDCITKQVREIFSSDSVEIRSPFISRDGKLLYYTAGIDQSDIWLLDNTKQSQP